MSENKIITRGDVVFSVGKAVDLSSRIMAVGLFFVSGIEKVFSYKATEALMIANHVNPIFLPFVIFLEVFGSFLIIFSVSDTIVPLVMFLFSILSGFLFYKGFSYPHLMVWLKNISCGAGFLILYLHSNPRKDRFLILFNRLVSRR